MHLAREQVYDSQATRERTAEKRKKYQPERRRLLMWWAPFDLNIRVCYVRRRGEERDRTPGRIGAIAEVMRLHWRT